ncbi:hypothetical protein QJS10_CPB14g01124 [Acorus calamus]|uniref:Reverse transcriptase n=1 Tax=Acorus calamus TaxID=4465 RepID=A0AAV9DEJ2_ACOCL|nr:hypothetical protein QJS10_CPB14g01124 [Acorus calamus]
MIMTSWMDLHQISGRYLKDPPFTWCNNRRRQDRIWELLDRAFINSSWQDIFLEMEAIVLPRVCYDHAPLLVDSSPPRPQGYKPFRFEQFWFKYMDLPERVREAWLHHGVRSPLGRLQQKIHSLQKTLRSWNRNRVGDLRRNLDSANNSLSRLLSREQFAEGEDGLEDQIRMATNKVKALERQWEIFWAQRARDKWITHGDQNTKYFQAMVNHRRGCNRISQLKTAEGVILSEHQQINDYVKDYFEHHWDSREADPSLIPDDLISCQLNEEDALMLVQHFSVEEIERVVKTLPKNKAPGPDGLPGEFYQKFWPIIREDALKVRKGHRALMATKIGLASSVMHGKATHGRFPHPLILPMCGEIYVKDSDLLECIFEKFRGSFLILTA